MSKVKFLLAYVIVFVMCAGFCSVKITDDNNLYEAKYDSKKEEISVQPVIPSEQTRRKVIGYEVKLSEEGESYMFVAGLDVTDGKIPLADIKERTGVEKIKKLYISPISSIVTDDGGLTAYMLPDGSIRAFKGEIPCVTTYCYKIKVTTLETVFQSLI